jgi:hypothetical protein
VVSVGSHVAKTAAESTPFQLALPGSLVRISLWRAVMVSEP